MFYMFASSTLANVSNGIHWSRRSHDRKRPGKQKLGRVEKTIRWVSGRLNYHWVDLIKALRRISMGLLQRGISYTLFCFYKNVVFPAQAEYSYFSRDFRLKIFLYYS